MWMWVMMQYQAVIRLNKSMLSMDQGETPIYRAIHAEEPRMKSMLFDLCPDHWVMPYIWWRKWANTLRWTGALLWVSVICIVSSLPFIVLSIATDALVFMYPAWGLTIVAILCIAACALINQKGDQYYKEFKAEDRICMEEFNENVIRDIGYQPEWLAESMGKLYERR